MGDDFVEDIRRVAMKYALPNTMNGVQIVQAELGDNAGIIGASVLARQNIGD